jgi:hypothetical protein
MNLLLVTMASIVTISSFERQEVSSAAACAPCVGEYEVAFPALSPCPDRAMRTKQRPCFLSIPVP